MHRAGCSVIALFLLLSTNLFGQTGYPVPKVENLLFYVQHNRGHNTFLYSLNFQKDGPFNRVDPVAVRRQLFDEDDAIKGLTRVQNLFAYGVKGRYVNDKRYEFTMAGHGSQIFILDLREKKPRVRTKVNGQEIFLERMFLHQTEGTSGLNTRLDYILFYGEDSAGHSLVEKLIPQ
ncbi:MAG: DUF4833 domain-containing protein [Sphingobacterium sp.]|uniref:DUF4833 domain-containing protein n=1 Tax=Sphingobacterium sp. JB170 TaxID=1434842 RepID=UPI00097EDA74|nr:DUF4833 domain-containing protein [Sphingobacterium sp. JB170]SJN44180.1 hypothetical protein FM107_12740 [Sphingobacterium sp. JB170]